MRPDHRQLGFRINVLLKLLDNNYNILDQVNLDKMNKNQGSAPDGLN